MLGGESGNRASPEIVKAAAWMDNYSKASRWMRKYDINQLLDAGGGIVRMENFLPDFVAEAVLQVLQAIPTKEWNATAAGEDYTHNNISHQFLSTKHASTIIDAVVRVISLLLPGQLNAFSAARYDQTHHIAPHDDRAYTPVKLDSGKVITCSREIGVIWYLTEDWQEEYGGALVDLEGGSAYVPLFNSAVMFRVPRFHEVTPLTTTRPRYSIFGWFLQPGRRYELFLGQEGGQAAAQQEQQQEREEGGAFGAGGRREGGRRSIGARDSGGGKGSKRRKSAAAAMTEQQQQQCREERGGQEAGYACKLARQIATNVTRRRRGQQGEAEEAL